jgi:membrane fusion protein (multidrug efflux system)
VPDLAIKRDALGNYVFVLEAGDNGTYRAKLMPVELGERQGDHVMILSGIEAGQLIANKGSFKLFPGMKVYLAKEAAQDVTKETAQAVAADVSAQ